MSDHKVLRKIVLGQSHQRTGRTRHFRDGIEVPSPYELRIVKYPDDPGYYLFYCDKSGEEITDTYHDSLNEAKTQAEEEFCVKPDEWEIIGY